MKIVIASENNGKIRELQTLLQTLAIDGIPQKELGIESIPETGLSFVENAIMKARHAANVAKLPAIADDSGLTVAALMGKPGIYSARFAGSNATDQENMQKLLAELQQLKNPIRDAFFYCVLVFMKNAEDPTPIISEGKWHGVILDKPQGENGFGYDPIFYLPALTKTAAELSLDIKNKISHRGLALRTLMNKLSDDL